MQYLRAPVTEAVIELKYEQPLSARELSDLRSKFAEDYPFIEEQTEFEIELNPTQTEVRRSSAGYKVADADQTNVMLLRPQAITTSRLAPYHGWEIFRKRAQLNWERARSIVGYRKLTRVGVRFLNRIDIPTEPGTGVEISDYLLLFPHVPKELPQRLTGYTSRIESSIIEEELSLVINTGQVPSPVLNHVSFLLDIDISKEKDIPQNEAELWAMVDLVRPEKNKIFEACITEKSRRLFHNA